MDRTDDEREKAAKPEAPSAAPRPVPGRGAGAAQGPTKPREDRRAQALRANLRRRKAQARGRREGGNGEPDDPGADPGRGRA